MSKYKDGLIGFIVGDAMGVPTEFLSRNQLLKKPVIDMIGWGLHQVPPGTWSDDTSMTLAIIESINNNEGKINYYDISKNFVAWYRDAPKFNAIDYVFDIGGTCSRAIEQFIHTGDPLNAGSKNNGHVGNGALMRISPLAYYIQSNNITDENEIIELTGNISSLTHAQETSRLGCYIYIRYMLMLLEGKDKRDAYEQLKKIDYTSFSQSAQDAYKRVIKENIEKLPLDSISSEGEVVDTLEAAIWMLLKTNDYKHAILGCINLGKDTDTIAAICGSMAGLVYGIEQIPEKWINTLLKKEQLFEMIEKFEKTLTQPKEKAKTS